MPVQEQPPVADGIPGAVPASPFKTEPFEEYYAIGREIGRGHFAVVHEVHCLRTGCHYAGKFVRKKRARASRRGARYEDIVKEVDILRDMSHENVITLHEVYENCTDVILVLELVSGGELFDFISEKESCTEEDASQFIRQILRGLDHMHNKCIAHLDLKPENILLLDRTSTDIKLIDFGLSRKLTKGMQVREMMGTPEFVAPEVINYEPLCLGTDLWSVGVITYILLSGASPFLGDNRQETFENICGLDYSFDDDLFANTSELAKDFICRLLVRDPRKRENVRDYLNHPWIKPKLQQEVEEVKTHGINMQSFKSANAKKLWKPEDDLCAAQILRSMMVEKEQQEQIDAGSPVTDNGLQLAVVQESAPEQHATTSSADSTTLYHPATSTPHLATPAIPPVIDIDIATTEAPDTISVLNCSDDTNSTSTTTNMFAQNMLESNADNIVSHAGPNHDIGDESVVMQPRQPSDVTNNNIVDNCTTSLVDPNASAQTSEVDKTVMREKSPQLLDNARHIIEDVKETSRSPPPPPQPCTNQTDNIAVPNVILDNEKENVEVVVNECSLGVSPVITDAGAPPVTDVAKVKKVKKVKKIKDDSSSSSEGKPKVKKVKKKKKDELSSDAPPGESQQNDSPDHLVSMEVDDSDVAVPESVDRADISGLMEKASSTGHGGGEADVLPPPIEGETSEIKVKKVRKVVKKVKTANDTTANGDGKPKIVKKVKKKKTDASEAITSATGVVDTALVENSAASVSAVEKEEPTCAAVNTCDMAVIRQDLPNGDVHSEVGVIDGQGSEQMLNGATLDTTSGVPDKHQTDVVREETAAITENEVKQLEPPQPTTTEVKKVRKIVKKIKTESTSSSTSDGKPKIRRVKKKKEESVAASDADAPEMLEEAQGKTDDYSDATCDKVSSKQQIGDLTIASSKDDLMKTGKPSDKQTSVNGSGENLSENCVCKVKKVKKIKKTMDDSNKSTEEKPRIKKIKKKDTETGKGINTVTDAVGESGSKKPPLALSKRRLRPTTIRSVAEISEHCDSAFEEVSNMSLTGKGLHGLPVTASVSDVKEDNANFTGQKQLATVSSSPMGSSVRVTRSAYGKTPAAKLHKGNKSSVKTKEGITRADTRTNTSKEESVTATATIVKRKKVVKKVKKGEKACSKQDSARVPDDSNKSMESKAEVPTTDSTTTGEVDALQETPVVQVSVDADTQLYSPTNTTDSVIPMHLNREFVVKKKIQRKVPEPEIIPDISQSDAQGEDAGAVSNSPEVKDNTDVDINVTIPVTQEEPDDGHVIKYYVPEMRLEPTANMDAPVEMVDKEQNDLDFSQTAISNTSNVTGVTNSEGEVDDGNHAMPNIYTRHSDTAVHATSVTSSAVGNIESISQVNDNPLSTANNSVETTESAVCHNQEEESYVNTAKLFMPSVSGALQDVSSEISVPDDMRYNTDQDSILHTKLQTIAQVYEKESSVNHHSVTKLENVVLKDPSSKLPREPSNFVAKLASQLEKGPVQGTGKSAASEHVKPQVTQPVTCKDITGREFVTAAIPKSVDTDHMAYMPSASGTTQVDMSNEPYGINHNNVDFASNDYNQQTIFTGNGRAEEQILVETLSEKKNKAKQLVQSKLASTIAAERQNEAALLSPDDSSELDEHYEKIKQDFMNRHRRKFHSIKNFFVDTVDKQNSSDCEGDRYYFDSNNINTIRRRSYVRPRLDIAAANKAADNARSVSADDSNIPTKGKLGRMFSEVSDDDSLGIFRVQSPEAYENSGYCSDSATVQYGRRRRTRPTSAKEMIKPRALYYKAPSSGHSVAPLENESKPSEQPPSESISSFSHDMLPDTSERYNRETVCSPEPRYRVSSPSGSCDSSLYPSPYMPIHKDRPLSPSSSSCLSSPPMSPTPSSSSHHSTAGGRAYDTSWSRYGSTAMSPPPDRNRSNMASPPTSSLYSGSHYKYQSSPVSAYHHPSSDSSLYRTNRYQHDYDSTAAAYGSSNIGSGFKSSRNVDNRQSVGSYHSPYQPTSPDKYRYHRSSLGESDRKYNVATDSLNKYHRKFSLNCHPESQHTVFGTDDIIHESNEEGSCTPTTGRRKFSLDPAGHVTIRGPSSNNRLSNVSLSIEISGSGGSSDAVGGRAPAIVSIGNGSVDITYSRPRRQSYTDYSP